MIWIAVAVFVILLFPCIEGSDDVIIGFGTAICAGLLVLLICFTGSVLWFDNDKVEVIGTQNVEIVSLNEVQPKIYDEEQYVVFDGHQYIFYISTNGFLEKQTFDMEDIEAIKYSTDDKAIMFVEKLQLKSDFARWFFLDGVVKESRTTLIVPKDSDVEYVMVEGDIM